MKEWVVPLAAGLWITPGLAQTTTPLGEFLPSPCDAKALESNVWCVDLVQVPPPPPPNPTIHPPPVITGTFATITTNKVQLTGKGVPGDIVSVATDSAKDTGLVAVQAGGNWTFNASAGNAINYTSGALLHLGAATALLSTSNYFNGYLGTPNAFDTRVADSLIGVTGTNYYFAAAANGGADTNDCLAGTAGGGHGPCLTIGKAASIRLVTNDTLNFNGGDTFVGCWTENGGINWNATRIAPATIQSYGTGQAILTPNCAGGGFKRAAILTLNNTDGVVINNVEFLGDSAGNGNIGILIENTDGTNNHGNILIENNLCTGLHDNTMYEGACIFRYPRSVKMIDHVTILNNTDAGATTTSTDNNFMWSFGNRCATEYDAIQGNVIYNLGGYSSARAGSEGTGIYTTGVCGLKSAIGAPSGTPGAIVQFNVVHDTGQNMSGCGAHYAIWGVQQDSIIYRMNEVYNIHLTAGCDAGAFDFDGGGRQPTTNGLAERNYAHNDFGPCILFFAPATNVTFRWNICDGEGTSGQGVFVSVGSTTGYIYNNIFVQNLNVATGAEIYYNGCPNAGSLFANNIVVNRNNGGQQNMFSIGQQNSTNQCTTLPIGGLTMTHNDWWSTHSPFNIWATTNQQMGSAHSSSTNLAAMVALTGETGAVSVDPLFQSPYGQVTCDNSSAGPQIGSCPSGMKLQLGSAMHAPAGAILTRSPWNLPVNNGGGVNNPTNGLGTLDYYGTALPCPTTGGVPIGAQC